MVNRNIQMKKKNNDVWDNLYPLTLTENVFSNEEGIDLNTIITNNKNDLNNKIDNIEILVDDRYELLDNKVDDRYELLDNKIEDFNFINLKDFDVKGDGVSDDTLKIQNAFNLAYNENKTLFIPNGIYACNNIEIKTPIHMGNSVEFIFNGVSGDTLMLVTTEGSFYDYLKLDGDNKDCSLLRINGNNNLFNLIEIKNILMKPTTPNHCFGVSISGVENTINQIKGKNLINGNYHNESFPQAILSDGKDTVIGSIVLKDITSGLVTTANNENYSEYTYVNSLSIINASDNGIYNLPNSSLKMGTMFYHGKEEPAVFTGNSVYIGDFYIKGDSGRIGFQNINQVRINNIFLEVDEEGLGSKAIFRTRKTNTQSGIISIGNISGELVSDRAGCQLWLLDTGIVKYLTIENMDIVHIYKNNYDSLSRYADMTACQQLKIGDVNLKIVDFDNQFTSSDVFYMMVPDLIKKSFFKSLSVDIVQEDGRNNSPAIFRGIGLKQELLKVENIVVQSNIGPYVRENAYGLAKTTNSKPNVGYWHKGDVYYNLAVTPSSPIGWICIESGSPGVWREL